MVSLWRRIPAAIATGRNAADFVFLHESLSAVTDALDISRRAGVLVRQNFALAIGYNAVAVPIAVAGYVTPLVAAVAMSLFDPRGGERIAPRTRKSHMASGGPARRRLVHGGEGMSYLALLVPTAILMGLAGLAPFMWTLRSKQSEDLEGAAHRILIDDHGTDSPA